MLEWVLKFERFENLSLLILPNSRTVFTTKITAIYIFLLLGIDGLGAIYFRNATQNISTLYSFMQNGAYSTYARGVYPTVNIEKLPHCALYTLFITSFPKRPAKPKKTGNRHCFFLRKTRPCRVTYRYSISVDEKIASNVANQIAPFPIENE